MALTKVLIAVTTYPLPSRSYDELVCTAGLREDGTWIRIFPIPLSFLIDLKGSGKVKKVKYTWIELELIKRTDDFRPESYSPKHYDFRDLRVLESIDTARNWTKRKDYCCTKVYTNMSSLIDESKEPLNVSLVTFKPTKFLKFVVEEDTREWKDEWKELRKQTDLFATDISPEKLIPKLPYKFYYQFEDDSGKTSRLMIEDWEIGALFWNCLRRSEGDEQIALEMVRKKYETEFFQTKDLFLFLGTTKEWHQRRGKNPFLIIGVFYPKKESQLSLDI